MLNKNDEDHSQQDVLKRELGIFGATMMGLGSIVGTGIFVSIGVAAGSAGPSVILAIILAAIVATCNAFSIGVDVASLCKLEIDDHLVAVMNR